MMAISNKARIKRMAKYRYNAIEALVKAGIAFDDATALRRISMTLSRWHELECGDSDAYSSWCITRGRKGKTVNGKTEFAHDDDGAPYLERHYYGRSGMNDVTYSKMPDRERGALRRLESIMKRYPGFAFYVQGDPRGASLYIMRPDDMAKAEGDNWLSCNYTRGIAVCK